jgi:hypothetical protein
LECATVFKVNEGRPNVADHIKQGEIALIINTPLGRASHYDEQAIRRAALQYNVPCVTTMTGAQALVEALTSRIESKEISVHPLAGVACSQRLGAVKSCTHASGVLGLRPLMCGKALPFRQSD